MIDVLRKIGEDGGRHCGGRSNRAAAGSTGLTEYAAAAPGSTGP